MRLVIITQIILLLFKTYDKIGQYAAFPIQKLLIHLAHFIYMALVQENADYSESYDEADTKMASKTTSEVRLSHPEIASKILTQLYRHQTRSSDIISNIVSKFSVSNATVYNVLNELVKNGLVEKIPISAKNVQYKLTPNGSDIINDEMSKNHSLIIESLAFSDSPRIKEISVDALVLAASRSLSPEWRDSRHTELIRKYFTVAVEREIETLRQLIENRFIIDVSEQMN